eukprot:6472206-Amphidinium_carterae.2
MQKFDYAELNRVGSDIDFNELFNGIQQAWDESDDQHMTDFDTHVRRLNNTRLAVQEVDLVVYPRDSFREHSLSPPPQWETVSVGCKRYFPHRPPHEERIEMVTCESLVALLAQGAFIELSIPAKTNIHKAEAVKRAAVERKTNKLRFLTKLRGASHSVFETFEVIMMFNGDDATEPPCHVIGTGKGKGKGKQGKGKGKQDKEQVFLHFNQVSMQEIPEHIHDLELRRERQEREQERQEKEQERQEKEQERQEKEEERRRRQRLEAERQTLEAEIEQERQEKEQERRKRQNLEARCKELEEQLRKKSKSD